MTCFYHTHGLVYFHSEKLFSSLLFLSNLIAFRDSHVNQLTLIRKIHKRTDKLHTQRRPNHTPLKIYEISPWERVDPQEPAGQKKCGWWYYSVHNCASLSPPRAADIRSHSEPLLCELLCTRAYRKVKGNMKKKKVRLQGTYYLTKTSVNEKYTNLLKN